MESRKRDCSMIYLQSNLTKMSTLLQIHFSLPGIKNTQIYLAPFLVLHISSVFSTQWTHVQFYVYLPPPPPTHTLSIYHVKPIDTKGEFWPKEGVFYRKYCCNYIIKNNCLWYFQLKTCFHERHPRPRVNESEPVFPRGCLKFFQLAFLHWRPRCNPHFRVKTPVIK